MSGFPTGAGGGALQPPGDQWLRRWSLVTTHGQPGTAPSGDSRVLSTSDEGLDLRVKFLIHQADAQTPNTAIIRVYNLKDSTALSVIQEYNRVVLSAGYINGRFGVIFDGVLKQFKKGRESPTDTYLDLFAADGDMAYNEAMSNQTLPAGSTASQRFKALQNDWRGGDPSLQTPEPEFTLDEAILNRPRVYFGLTADETRDFAKDRDATWNITNGRLVLTPRTSYATGDIVVLNSATGMVNFPEATQDGVMVTCLLNPSIRLRQRIKIDNKSINFFFSQGGGGASGTIFPGYGTQPNYYASPAADGVYCALVIDYEGDTRGMPWYNYLTCLAVDPSVAAPEAIKAVG